VTPAADQACEDRPSGLAAVCQTLDERGIDHEVIRHPRIVSAMAEARESGASPRRTVKTVAIRTGGQLVSVALPASERLNLERVRHLLGDPEARLATEAELAHELPNLEAGALPPFGAPAPPLALLDRRILSSNWVLANAGDRRHSVRVSPLQIVRLSPRARVVDISEY